MLLLEGKTVCALHKLLQIQLFQTWKTCLRLWTLSRTECLVDLEASGGGSLMETMAKMKSTPEKSPKDELGSGELSI